jgi:DNA-binding LacI/PurR family transcriptional regulator
MATIDDVAKKAGVSKGTVSNVFSKKRPISREVSERVLSVISLNNYAMLAQETSPKLTCLELFLVLGTETARLLFEKMNSTSDINKHLIIPAKLVFRESCGLLS